MSDKASAPARRALWLLALAACAGEAVTSGETSAGETAPLCDDGAQTICSCDDGRPGLKTCVEHGTMFTTCVCDASSKFNMGSVNSTGGGKGRVAEEKFRIQVLAKDGTAVTMATIVADGKRPLGTTDAKGVLEVPFADAKLSAVTISAPGYVDNVKRYDSAGTKDTFMTARLLPVGKSQTVDPTATAVVQHASASITIPANTLVDDTGAPVTDNVTVDFTYVAPGEDLDAIGSFDIRGSSDEILQSLGVAAVRARSSSGAAIDLAPGKFATLQIPANNPDNMSVPPPPLWRQNTTAGGWDQAGKTTWTQQGQAWVAQVDALATWNCDYPSKVTCLRGSLEGPSGKALSGVEVRGLISGTAANFLPANTVQSATTGSAGSYCMEVVPNASVQVSVVCPGGNVVDLGTMTAPNAPGARCSGSNCPDLGTTTACCFRDSDCDQEAGERCVQGVCQTNSCDSQQTSGGDTPETRTVDLAKKAGKFTFSYDAYSVKDQFIISYEGKVLHDSGCVSGGQPVELMFRGSDTFVTVQVVPNCEGDSGTAWDFSVGCPQ